MENARGLQPSGAAAAALASFGFFVAELRAVTNTLNPCDKILLLPRSHVRARCRNSQSLSGTTYSNDTASHTLRTEYLFFYSNPRVQKPCQNHSTLVRGPLVIEVAEMSAFSSRRRIVEVPECVSCGSENIVTDTREGHMVCDDCGVIQRQGMISTSTEYRNFSESDKPTGKALRTRSSQTFDSYVCVA
jgi:predicted RNA-binding Zn-ribbon protein involved in translation (DUF1610 family)